MLDLKKRRTLKLLGAAPLVSMPVIASVGHDGVMPVDTPTDALTASTAQNNMPLQIQIIDSTAVPDNNVIIRNISDEDLLVTRFMPGHIYFNEQIMDLNEAVNQQPLHLHAGQNKAFEFKLWPVVNAGPVEYVWADHAVEALNAETSVVTLSAFMADTNAVVYANTHSYAPT